MKLGLSTWSYAATFRRGAMDLPGFIREAKRLGVDGVELLDFFWQDREADWPAVEAALAETGLPVGVYSVANNFVLADPSERASEVGKITQGVDDARRLGAQTVRVFSGNADPAFAYEQGLAWIIDGLKKAAAYAHERGVTLALENHGHLAGRSDQVQTILDAVASPALQANPDTGNFLLVHQAPHLAVAALAPRAAMCHFKDFRLVPDDYAGFAYAGIEGLKFTGTAIGEGDVDLADCVASLRRAGFDGWMNIEYEGEEDPTVAVARSVENARRLLASASE